MKSLTEGIYCNKQRGVEGPLCDPGSKLLLWWEEAPKLWRKKVNGAKKKKMCTGTILFFALRLALWARIGVYVKMSFDEIFDLTAGGYFNFYNNISNVRSCLKCIVCAI